MVLGILQSISEIIKYFLLGLIQGIAEILPISSSGHLVVYQAFLQIGTTDNLILEVWLHFASLLALVIFFRTTILQLIIGFFQYTFNKKQEYRPQFDLVLYLVVATIPVVIVGLFLEPVIIHAFSSLLFVAIGFSITAMVLLFVYKKAIYVEKDLNYKSALLIGLAQCVGVLPGVSRSGMTLSAARFAKVPIQKGKEFVFLLFIPVTLGSFIVSIGDLNLTNQLPMHNLIIAMISTFVFTFLALNFIFKKLQYRHYKYFAIYCFIMSLATLLMFIGL